MSFIETKMSDNNKKTRGKQNFDVKSQKIDRTKKKGELGKRKGEIVWRKKT